MWPQANQQIELKKRSNQEVELAGKDPSMYTLKLHIQASLVKVEVEKQIHMKK